MVAVGRGLARMHDGIRQLPAGEAVSTDTLLGLFWAGAELVSDPRLAFSPSELRTAREAVDLVQAEMRQLSDLEVERVIQGALLGWGSSRVTFAVVSGSPVVEVVVVADRGWVFDRQVGELFGLGFAGRGEFGEAPLNGDTPFGAGFLIAERGEHL